MGSKVTKILEIHKQKNGGLCNKNIRIPHPKDIWGPPTLYSFGEEDPPLASAEIYINVFQLNKVTRLSGPKNGRKYFVSNLNLRFGNLCSSPNQILM
jgi:hypothetical protein